MTAYVDDDDFRALVGNTNVAVLRLRRDEADAALAPDPSPLLAAVRELVRAVKEGLAVAVDSDDPERNLLAHTALDTALAAVTAQIGEE